MSTEGFWLLIFHSLNRLAGVVGRLIHGRHRFEENRGREITETGWAAAGEIHKQQQ